jgi:hypothetical protein
LKNLANQDPQRWIPIAEIIKFNKMNKLTKSVEEIVLAVQNSSVVELNTPENTHLKKAGLVIVGAGKTT